MFNTMKLAAASLALLAGLAAYTPLYADNDKKPPADTMMQGGNMEGMTGMMDMMDMMMQMNKMMGLCSKMMEASLNGSGGMNMPMPQQTPEAPKQGG